MSRHKKTTATPSAPAPVREPSEYERGVFDTLALLDEAINAVTDAETHLRGVGHSASPEVRVLLGPTNATANVAAHIGTVVHSRAAKALSAALVAARSKVLP